MLSCIKNEYKNALKESAPRVGFGEKQRLVRAVKTEFGCCSSGAGRKKAEDILASRTFSCLLRQCIGPGIF